ncbi:MAG TPA: branched-chain amino acid ABC transporter substrate-binding protein [Candidatus Acidoferrum sp.]|nr:branched-chain amino acid ABC transporter substrate-binding protein [Candidatus Acidoferrum sp.]
MQPSLRSIACIGALTLLPLAACSGGGAGPKAGIEIGVDLPLSGIDGRAGTPTLNGVQFYVKQHPTLDSFTVAVKSRDDAVNGVDNAKLGAENVTALVGDPVVLGVIGPFDSAVARAAIPIANQAQLAMISPSASDQCLTKPVFVPAGLTPAHKAVACNEVGLPLPADLRPDKVNNFFRLATTDDLQGAAAADFAYKNLQLLRVAVLSDHEAYGQALADGFRTRFNELGGLVVVYQDFAPAAGLDLSAFFSQAKKEGAGAVYFGGVAANRSCSIRIQAAGALGAAAPFLGGDGIAEDPTCVRDAGAAAPGMYATVPAIDPDQAPSAKAAIAAFKAAYPRPADYGPYTMLAYDAAAVLYDAIDQAIKAAGGKLPSRADIVARLAATTVFTGVTGTFGFDSAGDTTSRIVSIFEAQSSDPAAPWPWVGAVDYSAKLPY